MGRVRVCYLLVLIDIVVNNLGPAVGQLNAVLAWEIVRFYSGVVPCW